MLSESPRMCFHKGVPAPLAPLPPHHGHCLTDQVAQDATRQCPLVATTLCKLEHRKTSPTQSPVHRFPRVVISEFGQLAGPRSCRRPISGGSLVHTFPGTVMMLEEATGPNRPPLRHFSGKGHPSILGRSKICHLFFGREKSVALSTPACTLNRKGVLDRTS